MKFDLSEGEETHCHVCEGMTVSKSKTKVVWGEHDTLHDLRMAETSSQALWWVHR